MATSAGPFGFAVLPSVSQLGSREAWLSLCLWSWWCNQKPWRSLYVVDWLIAKRRKRERVLEIAFSKLFHPVIAQLRLSYLCAVSMLRIARTDDTQS